MTLREPLAAQLTVQAGWTCEARLAPAFPSSALARGSLSVSSKNGSLLKALFLSAFFV